MATTTAPVSDQQQQQQQQQQLKLDEDLFKTVYPSEYYNQNINRNVRPDKRPLLGIRKTTVSVGSITSANGSAFVKQGNTSVTAGIKLEYGPPPPKGASQLIIGLELLPLCSSRFRPGKPSEQAQVVGEQISRLFTNLELVPTEQLVIEKGKAVWYLYADIYCLDYDGNIFDASLIALLAALRNVQIPKAVITKDELDVQLTNAPSTPLQLKDLPISLSFAVIDDHVIADPTSEEEGFASTTFSLVYNREGQLFSAFKPGGTPLSNEKLLECTIPARARVKSAISSIERAVAKAASSSI